MVLLQVCLNPAPIGLSEKFEIVGSFACEYVRQPVEESMALVVCWETVRDHGVVFVKPLRVLLHAGAVEGPTVDDQDLCWLEHSSQGQALPTESAGVHPGD